MGAVARPDALAYDPTLEQAARSAAVLLLVLCGVAALLDPGVLAGAALACGLWRLSRPHAGYRWAVALLLAVSCVLLHPGVLIGWPWRLAYGAASAHLVPSLTLIHPGPSLLRAVAIEVLAGPLVLQLTVLARTLLARRITAHFREQRRRDTRRRDALQEDVAGRVAGTTGHPSGLIRLGIEQETRRPFDLRPEELAEHVFLPGASGSGKTTTLIRLADGVLQLGAGVVILDCKGGDLKEWARVLAGRYRLPFNLVDPTDPDSLGYDPCTGDAADVSNKLVGVFNFQGAAEIYKLAAMRAIPILVEALQAAGERVTLRALQEALDGGLARLGRQAGEPYQSTLARLGDSKGVVAEDHLGLALRFGALLAGRFGRLFERSPALDWDRALSQPSVTYVALPATAASEDVELMGRIVAQDLKQVCARRFRALARGEHLVSTLLVIDEFAALREAEQFVDLLLQARQALMPTVLSTQYIPQEPRIRQAALQAGLIVAHRLESEDAQLLASQLGTDTVWEQTVQTGQGGATGMGSARKVEAFRIHPNHLRAMPRGHAAVRSVPGGNRLALVHVYRPGTEPAL